MKKILQIFGLLFLVGILTTGPFLPTIFKTNKAQTVMQLNEEEVSKTRVVIDEKDLPKIFSLGAFNTGITEECKAAHQLHSEAFYPMLLYAVPTPPPDFI